MKECPKCSVEHTKPGKFCSRACANSRVWSVESKQQRSEKLKKFIQENPSWKENQTAVLAKRVESFKETKYKNSLEKFLRGEMGINSSLKKWLIITRKEECEICKMGPEWNGFSLMLQVDHINGINNDNQPKNLRLLCPNCHSQTENYAGKKHRK